METEPQPINNIEEPKPTEDKPLETPTEELFVRGERKDVYHNGKKLYFDGILYDNLAFYKHKNFKNGFDIHLVIDGMEGAGKSVFGQQIAYFFDPTINLSRIVFSGEELLEAIKIAQPHQAIIFDEAFGGLSSTETMTSANRTIRKALAEMRVKKLFLIYICPSFFILDKYVALWRTRALFHVYVDDEWNRGRFLYFNYPKKIELYLRGIKTYDYNTVRSSFYGSFCNGYIVNEEEYTAKKLKALGHHSLVKTKADKYQHCFNASLDILKKQGLTAKEISAFLKDYKVSMSEPTICERLKKLREAQNNGCESCDIQ